MKFKLNPNLSSLYSDKEIVFRNHVLLLLEIRGQIVPTKKKKLQRKNAGSFLNLAKAHKHKTKPIKGPGQFQPQDFV